MKLDELNRELYALDGRIKAILRASGFEDYGEIEVEYDTQNPNEVQLANEYRQIIERLGDVSHSLGYFMLPVAREGKLRLNRNGRYELDGAELTSGEGVEVLLYDDYMECWEWYASRIEAKNGKYYLVGRQEIDLEGVTARQRERRW